MSPGKKKKLTKAEKLRMLQEEEERRQKEEEEARLKHEKEELERLETERREKEKWQKLEAKDLERRKDELEELHLLERCYPEAEKLKRENRLLSQWNHYIQCDGSPDPVVPQEMNTFISLWKEETNETFEEVAEKSQLVLTLIEKLQLILLENSPFDLEEKHIEQYQGSIQELQELLHSKFNAATEILLRQASTLAELDSGNMEKIIQHENVTLYLWANLKKNPRYRSIRFSETKIGFEIPRILATCDIALRLLHTHYDHVSPLNCVPKPFRVEQQTPVITESVKDQDKDTAEKADNKENLEESKQPESESVVINEEVKGEEEGAADVQTNSVKEKSEAMRFEVEMDLLSETIIAAQVKEMESDCEKPKCFEAHEVDLFQFTTVGGVYHLDILELPPQCRLVNGWTIVEILKEGLQKYVYPPESAEDAEMENAFPPINVTLQIQENVIFFEDPAVARWDPEGTAMPLPAYITIE